VLAQAPHQGAGVEALECRHPEAAQIGDQALVAVLARRLAGEAAGEEALDPRPTRLGELRRGAVVADVGLGHDHDLAAVGGVGQHLLVAGHRGVEHHLAEARAGSRGFALEDGAVFEQQQTGPELGPHRGR
jgi:hypothetical protein